MKEGRTYIILKSWADFTRKDELYVFKKGWFHRIKEVPTSHYKSHSNYYISIPTDTLKEFHLEILEEI